MSPPHCTTAETSEPPRYEDLATVLEPLREKHGLPALGAAVVSPNGIESLGVVGFRKLGDPTPACSGDAFHLGSDSKAMTAVVIAKLVEHKRLRWSATVSELLSDVADQDPAYASVTLEQLLAHRAGLSHNPTSVSTGAMRHLEGSLHQQREAYAHIALREPPTNKPGTAFSYSNTGYVLVGLMAERATGRAWEDLVRETLFVPLAMDNAGFGVTASPGRVDGLWAHAWQGRDPTPEQPGQDSDNPLLISPAGSVHVTMAGWASFIVDLLAGVEGTGRVLAKESYEHLRVPPFGGTYAYGWQTVERGWAGGTAYTHAGSNTLNFAVAWFAPARRFGVLVATNVGTQKAFKACDEVVGALIKRRL
jgi:CubicO group peptidase (beta-lactamase class C family)